MRRLLDEPDVSLGQLGELLQSAERSSPRPFAKQAVKLRLSRALAPGAGGGLPARQPVLVGGAGLLIAATAAAAGFGWLSRSETRPGAPRASSATSPVLAAPSADAAARPEAPPASEPLAAEPATGASEPADDALRAASPAAKRGAEKPRPGEDPTQVAEAVRALRKQGDAARAQALLDQYLKNNPRGALAEDALALSIEAAAARKDPRAAGYARRYLARYPSGRFRAVAERALGR